jgi:fructose-1,6-bisphosphatase/inositol monophosphatase family enzyme
MNLSPLLLPIVQAASRVIYDAMRSSIGWTSIGFKEGSTATRELDMTVQRLYVDALEKVLPRAAVLSEDAGWLGVAVDRAEFIVFLDPIDGTEVAARGIALSSTAISVTTPNGDPIFSAVGDVGLQRVFWAEGTDSYLDDRLLGMSVARPLEEALLAEYSFARRSSSIANLFATGYYLNYGGPLLIARLGDGGVDVVLEYQKGYHLYDLLPGHHIAANSGACFRDLRGAPLDWRDFNKRYTFVGASSVDMYEAVWPRLAAALPSTSIGDT